MQALLNPSNALYELKRLLHHKGVMIKRETWYDNHKKAILTTQDDHKYVYIYKRDVLHSYGQLTGDYTGWGEAINVQDHYIAISQHAKIILHYHGGSAYLVSPETISVHGYPRRNNADGRPQLLISMKYLERIR